MLLKLVPKLPEGEHWHYEVKWDGYRGIAVVGGGKARLWPRNERDLGNRFPVLVEALAKLPPNGGRGRLPPSMALNA